LLLEGFQAALEFFDFLLSGYGWHEMRNK